MKRVRFAPSPTGSLHVGNALSAVANRASATTCCCGSTTPTRRATSPAARRRSCDDLGGSGSRGTRGRCARASGRSVYRAAAERLGGDRFGHITLLREDGTATYHLASVVDDGEFGITHVVRGSDHRPNEELHRRLHEALGTPPPEVIHHGLVLRPDGGKLSKRDDVLVDRRPARGGHPRRGRARVPRRARRCRSTTCATTCRGSAGSRSRRSRRCSDEELAARVGVPVSRRPRAARRPRPERGARVRRRGADRARARHGRRARDARARSASSRGIRSSRARSCAS